MLQYAVYRQNVMSNLNLEKMCPSCQEVGVILCSIVNCFNLILLIIEMIFLFFFSLDINYYSVQSILHLTDKHVDDVWQY